MRRSKTLLNSKRTYLGLLASALPLGALVVCAAAAPPVKKAAAPAAAGSFERDVLPFMRKYCNSCHAGDEASAGVSPAEYKTGAHALKARNLWEKAAVAVSTKHMPPKGMPQPTDAERAAMSQWIEAAVAKADCDLKEPGRVTLRRLNRAEYNNTVRDLLNVSIRPADDFPSDDVGYGFDNIGDVLSISPLLMEKYIEAARKVSRAAIVAPEDKVPAVPMKWAANRFKGDGDGYSETNGWILMSAGAVGVDYDVPGPGEYAIRVVAFEQHAGPRKESAKMTFRVGDRQVRTVNVRTRQNNPGLYEATVKIEKAGRQRVSVSFDNDYYNQDNADVKLRGDRNLVVQTIEVIPQGVTVEAPKVLPLSHYRIVKANPAAKTPQAMDAATRTNLAPFLKRAFRRPVTKAEVERYVQIAAKTRKLGLSFERGMQVAVQAALVSPNFLFHVEADPANAFGKRLLNDHELATRLAYFLWSSTPDDALLSLADKGKLKDPAVLIAQAKRMLKDPKAKALSDNFAGQWLNLRKIAVVTPDPKTFPNFNESLRSAMRTETETYFQYVATEDRPITEFLDSNYTFLNETLAKHYGNMEVKGDEFRRVVLKSNVRGGLLSQASILTLTSNPTRTSPVKRGKWVLDNILGTPPPPAPPNVPELADDKAKGPLTGTLRQRLEQHRENPSCASCHQRMDPIGFGLENFDAIGAWRVKDGENAVDASGTMPDGKSFAGPGALKGYLKSKKNLFTRAFTEKMLTYALGRGIESHDRCNLDTMAAGVAKKGYRFTSVVEAVITSEPFRYRSVKRAAPTDPKRAQNPHPANTPNKREVATR